MSELLKQLKVVALTTQSVKLHRFIAAYELGEITVADLQKMVARKQRDSAFHLNKAQHTKVYAIIRRLIFVNNQKSIQWQK